MGRGLGKLVALVMLGGAVVGCGDGNGPDQTPDVTVDVGNLFFRSKNGSSNPAVDTVAVGGTVQWTWIETGTHTVSPVGEPALTESAELTAQGSTYSVRFTKAGTYQYLCDIHPEIMTGRVVVQ